MTTQQKLLQLLADGQQHSGEEIAQVLGMSRAAVWKQIHQLEELGIVIDAQPGKGYRLRNCLDFLSAEAIRQTLAPATLAASELIDVRWSTESTNTLLAALGPPASGSLQVAARGVFPLVTGATGSQQQNRQHYGKKRLHVHVVPPDVILHRLHN